jgi:plasmid stabilization system protein ParE
VTLPLVFRRQFQRDLAAGFDWFERQRIGLGDEFVATVQSTLKNVELYPEIFVSVHGDVRRAIVLRFPFALFYLVEPRRIVVLRVLHTARDPSLWPCPRQ